MTNFFEMDESEAREVEEAEELTHAPAGEYNLEIIDFYVDDDKNVIRTNKNGLPFILPAFKIVDADQEYKSFSCYIALPDNEVPDDKKRGVRVRFRTFCDAFGIDYRSRIDWAEDCVGKGGAAILRIESDEEYGDKNAVGKFIVPK